MTHIYGSSSSNFSKISQFSLKNHTKNFHNLRQIEVNNRQIYWSIWWHLMCFINILTFREFYELNVTWPHVRCIELRLLRQVKTTKSLFINLDRLKRTLDSVGDIHSRRSKHAHRKWYISDKNISHFRSKMTVFESFWYQILIKGSRWGHQQEIERL